MPRTASSRRCPTVTLPPVSTRATASCPTMMPRLAMSPALSGVGQSDLAEMRIVAVSDFLHSERCLDRALPQCLAQHARTTANMKANGRQSCCLSTRWLIDVGVVMPANRTSRSLRFDKSVRDAVTCRLPRTAYGYHRFRLRRMFAVGRAGIRLGTCPRAKNSARLAQRRGRRSLFPNGLNARWASAVAHRWHVQHGRNQCGRLRRGSGSRRAHCFRPN